jgi:ribosomal protein S18 acetylase RimI-like enzyme
MEGIELRVPRRDEAAAIADVLNAQSFALTGRLDVTVDDITYWFDEPGLDPERDMRVAVAPDGKVAAYADLGCGEEEGEPVWIDLRLRPGSEHVGAALLAAMERNAVGRGAPPRRLLSIVHSDDAAGHELLRGAGYSAVRSGYRMEIDLAAEPAAPLWPDGLVARALVAGEERRAYEAHMAAFADSLDFYGLPYAQWLFWLFGEEEDRAFAFVVEDADELAAVSICRERRGGDLELGWIHVLGVRPPWRRRGLGRALLLHSFHELRARGKPRAGLGVDAENTSGAVRLYESAGMHVVRRSDVYEKAP